MLNEQEIRDLINSGKNVFIINGEKKKLFISTLDRVCLFNKGSRKRGYPLQYVMHQIESIEPYISKVDRFSGAYYRKRLVKVHKLLSASGYWGGIKNEIEKLLEQSDEKIEKLLNITDWNERTKAYKELGLTRDLGLDCLRNSICRIKSVNYHSWEKDEIVGKLNEAVVNKKSYSYRWTKGYDNSVFIDVNPTTNIVNATYCEEYINCGNGHYYILLDATHAMFSEDD